MAKHKATQAQQLGQRCTLTPRAVAVGHSDHKEQAKSGTHDYDSDGQPDILKRDTAGRLWLSDTTYESYDELCQPPQTIVGGGWNVYDRIEASGNLGGASVDDVVARDRDGVLWLYLGYGDGHFAPRSRIGGGWNTYTHLVDIGDANLDDRPDLYGINRNVPTVFYGNHTYDLFA